MRKIPARQVHLDFHTSPHIPGVGEKFDKAQFQAALKEGNVNSITVFAKCHHGLCYYPTKYGTVHPTMPEGMDLTGLMIEAAQEVGVAAPVYITAGWSALDAEEHPEWLMVDKNGNARMTNVNPDAQPSEIRPITSWKNLCLSGVYAQHIYDLTKEIAERYPTLDGLFYDIVFLDEACYCPNCIKGMREEGLDPTNEEDAKEYYRLNHLRFMQNCADILYAKHPEATIFFNGGAEIYRPEYHVKQSHIEMEDLPTTWGGYNKMPARASFMTRYENKDYLGMTGKFHTSWGEFGGYKNPDALKYEALLMAMYGAKCSTGDQMPPNGVMDMETYRVIGKAYRALEAIEPWAFPASSTADLGVYLCGDDDADEGLHTMLLESHIDFDIAMPGEPIDRFKALILPDSVKLSEEEAARIQTFIENGGSVLFNYKSAIKNGCFQIDAGVAYEGEAILSPDYFQPGCELRLPFGNAPFLCYQGAERTRVIDAEVIGDIYEPWFNRTYETYCSHQYTPYKDAKAGHPAAVRKGNVIYLAHPLCKMYKTDGAQLFREVLIKVLSLIYTPKYKAALMSAGRTRLTFQKAENRYVFHAAYASPIQRGRTSVIEDIPPIYQTPVVISIAEEVKQVKLVPEGNEIPFTQEAGALSFTIPLINCYQAVEIKL